MRCGSLFSGVGGMDLGLARAGFVHEFFAEADPYRRAVLSRHWPGVPVYDDVRVVARGEDGDQAGNGRHRHLDGAGHDQRTDRRAAGGHPGAHAVDLLCGGFPCQDLSVAGRRKGLAGDRSGLFFEFARIADALLADGGWLLIENVPGLLSSHGGRDFAVLLATLAELGFHDCAWRVLDSRYLGVPQRRRRVFIVARRAGGRRACEVLLEPESGGGDFEASGEAGQRVAASLSKGSASAGVSAPGRRQEDDENIVPVTAGTLGGRNRGDELDRHGAYVAKTLTASERWDGETETFIAHTLRSEGFDASEDGTGRGTPLVCPAADPDGMREIAVAPRWLDGAHGPVACPIDPKPDGPRYAACGDAVTANVAEWIGRRILGFGVSRRGRDAA